MPSEPWATKFTRQVCDWGVIQPHLSSWFADKKTYPLLLQEDDIIRRHITKKYASAGISHVRIQRKADQLEVELRTARPGVLVGRQGSGIEELRSGIQAAIRDRSRQVCASTWWRWSVLMRMPP